MSKERSKRKLSMQKIFNLISFMFLLACVIFYGGRFIKLYIENNKVEETNSMAKDIKESNNENENFKNINGEYFKNDDGALMVHIYRIREKIEADSKNPMYLKTVRGLGYKIEKI